VVLILVSASIFASLVFAYFFLWTVSPEIWPVGEEKLPAFRYPLVAALLLAGSSAAIAYASRALKSARTHGHWPMRIALLIAIPLLIVVLGIDLYRLDCSPSRVATVRLSIPSSRSRGSSSPRWG
jgi:cytochrome c oxidase subunit I+III